MTLYSLSIRTQTRLQKYFSVNKVSAETREVAHSLLGRLQQVDAETFKWNPDQLSNVILAQAIDAVKDPEQKLIRALATTNKNLMSY